MHGTLVLPPADLAPRAFEKTPLRSADDLRRAVLKFPGALLRAGSWGLDRVLRLDPAGDLVEAQSATTWRALAEHAANTVPELGRLAQDTWLPRTIGQSLAQNAPGPDGFPLVEHIEAVALVTPDGQLRRASRTADSELFALAIGGHGAFGVPYAVTLRLSSLARSAARGAPAETLDLHPGENPATDRVTLYLPPERLQEFLGEARVHAQAWRIPIARVEVRHTQAEAQTRLRWAQRPYAAVALHLRKPCSLGGNLRTAQVQRALVEAAIARGGSFELAPRTFVAREHVTRCYPTMAAFFAEKQRYDPGERFENEWTRRYRALLRRDACEVRWAEGGGTRTARQRA